MDWHTAQRFRHTWIIGQTGTGKSTFLINQALGDIRRGEGVCFIDPHGDAIDAVLSLFPQERRGDVIVYDPSDYDYPVAWNPLAGVAYEQRAFVASAILDSLKSVWHYAIPTPQLDQILYNTTAALLDVPGASLLGMYAMLTSEPYRARVIGHVQDPVVRDFWRVFEALPEKEKREMTRSTLNKIQWLMADPRIRNSLAQPRSAFDLKEAMAEGKVLLMRLPHGRLGQQKANTIGALLLAQLHAAALSRHDAKPFHITIDECHHLGTPTLIEMLAGIRKFRVSLTLATQYLGQLREELQSAIIGNVGTKIAFRTGIEDAQRLESEFYVDNLESSLAELKPFVARVVTPTISFTRNFPDLNGNKNNKMRRRIEHQSRRSYASPRQHVEARIARFMRGG
jgi:type IV secretory pathway TraG/TraD family ATPase VirD4